MAPEQSTSEQGAPIDGAPCGFVFGTSGEAYNIATEQAARSLRAVSPDIPIDVFTDSDIDASLFDKVHALDRSWFRPKFESLIRSRFARTVYLDSDVFAVADISDIFDVLERFDIAATHIQSRNLGFAARVWRTEIPAAFPQINGGLIGIRKSPEVLALLEATQAAMIEHELPQDQPVLRELLFESDLRIAILPQDYNLRNLRLGLAGGRKTTAPRLLHSTNFVKRVKDQRAPTPEDLFSRQSMARLEQKIAQDQFIDGPSKTLKPAHWFWRQIARFSER